MSPFKLPPHGGAYGFPTTPTSLLALATGEDEELARTAFNDLWGRYVKPLTCYARAGRVSASDVKDLLQGFALWLWGEDKLAEYDRAKAPLRGFFMTLLDRYRIDVFRQANAQSRKPKKRLKSLDVPEVKDVADAECAGRDPESILNDQYFREILRMALAQELRRIQEKGNAQVIAMLQAWLSSENPVPPDYEALTTRSGLTENQVRSTIWEFRKRARDTARALLNAETLDHERATDDYVRMLATFGLLGGADLDAPAKE